MADIQKAPAFQLYARDWFVGTMTLSVAEQGSYMRLLTFQWTEGGIPDTSAGRARILGLSEPEEADIWKSISRHFKEIDGNLVNERLYNQYNELMQFRQEQSERGKLSAAKRWGNQDDNDPSNGGITTPLTVAQRSCNSSSSSSSSSSTTKNPPTPQGAFKGVEVPPELVPHLEALKEWEQYRKQRKVKTEAATWRKQFAFLKDQPDPEACINQSILQGWSGLFPVKSGMSPRDSMNDKRDRLLRGMA